MKTKKVMVVEDDHSIRLLLQHVLEDRYHVVAVKDGIEALSVMQDGLVPDLIISDLSMPKMNGEDFISTVRVSSFFKDVPVMVLSASNTSAERINCLEKGADDYLVKPFNPQELNARVANLFRRIQI